MELTLLDVGANGGYHPRWNQSFVTPNIILFDPLLTKNSQKHNTINFNIGLGEHQSKSIFNICKKRDVSSLLVPNYKLLNEYPNVERYDIINKEEIEVSTIDIECSSYNIDFLKIDAQGTGLNILRGAKEKINEIIGIEIEVEFTHLYKKQSLFSDVDKFIEKKDFQLMDISRVYWHKKTNTKQYYGKGDLIFGDALYFKNPKILNQLVKRKAKNIESIICCYLIYGYVSQAREFAKSFSFDISTILEPYSNLEYDESWRKCKDNLGNFFI